VDLGRFFSVSIKVKLCFTKVKLSVPLLCVCALYIAWKSRSQNDLYCQVGHQTLLTHSEID